MNGFLNETCFLTSLVSGFVDSCGYRMKTESLGSRRGLIDELYGFILFNLGLMMFISCVIVLVSFYFSLILAS